MPRKAQTRRRSLLAPSGLTLLCCALTVGGCSKSEPITKPWSDAFERATIGDDYLNTGGPYRIEKGTLRVKGAYNKPLWLKRALPRNGEIEFDVRSDSAAGDIKVEAWGDGQSYATHRGAYLASSYVFIMGGWGNSISALCRLDEHGKDRISRRGPKVEAGQTYRWKIRRKGSLVEWYVDGKLFLKMNDTAPLEGKNHAYLGFNNWASDITYDNLSIKPL